ncbi:hypothetical protein FOXYSP1_15995 [Fusarium oxysporum f. sp. phaseoli]
MGERTGSRIFHYLWSYVLGRPATAAHNNSSSPTGIVHQKTFVNTSVCAGNMSGTLILKS